MKKTILVTGAAGFIGSNLSAALLRKKYRVIGFDNLSQGSKCNLKTLLKSRNFLFIKGDVRNKGALQKAIKGAGCVVHLAAFKIPRYGNAYDTLIINTEGTRNVLEAACGVKSKVVFASTSDVYGMSPDLPFEESGNLVLGHSKVKRWAYATSKLFDEHLCFAYEEKYGLKVAVLRFFGSYGPHQNLTWWGGPQSVFIKAALENTLIEIHGDGRQTRSFTYIDDTVDGIIRAIENSKSAGEVFNIGNDKEISILGLARLIWKLVRGSQEPKIKFIPYSKFAGNYQDVRRRIPDLVKSKKILKFYPKVDLVTGLKKTIAWQREVMSD